jgi:hypothetical protein
VPYVKAVFADYDGYARRGRFQRHYDGAEAAGFHAAVIAPDGSLVRARMDGTTLYVSRVASPAPGSTFSSWTQLETGISSTGGVALCVVGSEVRLFFLASGSVNLRQRVSSDDGATWAAATTIISTGGGKANLAAAASDGSGFTNGDILLVWSEGAVLYRARYTGTWGARTAATPTFAGITGLAVAYLFDWQLIVTGTQVTTSHPRVFAVGFGDGINLDTDVWGTPREISGAYAGSNVSFGAPSVAYSSECWRLFFVESYAGSPAYTRQQWSTMPLSSDFNQEHWREPAAFDFDSSLGLSVAPAADRIWLVNSDGVWSSPLPALAELDVSGQVLEARVEGGRAEVLLPPELDAEAIVQRGVRLELQPGYRTSKNEVPVVADTYWVESVELVTAPAPQRGAHLVVKAREGWSLLERWRARRQFVFLAGDKAISQLLIYFTARAGLEYVVTGTSAQLTTLRPAFTVHAGESGLTAVRRLLAMVEDVPRWDGPRFETVLTSTGDAASYAVGGPGQHAVVVSRYQDAAPAVNRVRVEGLGVYGEALDLADIEASGERIATVVDVNLDAGSEATTRAKAVLRRFELEAEAGELKLFGVHCGIEVWDVLELTDARAGLAAEDRRVRGFAWWYVPARGRYEMSVDLGPV